MVVLQVCIGNIARLCWNVRNFKVEGDLLYISPGMVNGRSRGGLKIRTIPPCVHHTVGGWRIQAELHQRKINAIPHRQELRSGNGHVQRTVLAKAFSTFVIKLVYRIFSVAFNAYAMFGGQHIGAAVIGRIVDEHTGAVFRYGRLIDKQPDHRRFYHPPIVPFAAVYINLTGLGTPEFPWAAVVLIGLVSEFQEGMGNGFQLQFAVMGQVERYLHFHHQFLSGYMSHRQNSGGFIVAGGKGPLHPLLPGIVHKQFDPFLQVIGMKYGPQ